MAEKLLRALGVVGATIVVVGILLVVLSWGGAADPELAAWSLGISTELFQFQARTFGHLGWILTLSGAALWLFIRSHLTANND